MPPKILVALTAQYQVNDVLSCLKEVMKPGMKAVFLLPYPAQPWPYLRDHWIEAETAREAMLAGTKLLESYSWEAQTALAEQKFSAIRAALQKKEVDLEIQLYAGSFRKALQDHLARGDIYWIMTRAQTGDWLRSLSAVAFAPFGWFKRMKRSAVWLLYPVIGRSRS